MGRWLGIDYGTRRIGLAICDPDETLASPAGTLPGSGTPDTDAPKLLATAHDHDADGIVVGLPLNMDGTDSDQTRLSRRLADQLRTAGNLTVELWDERLSSFQADELLRAADVRPKRRRQLRDSLAALVILQAFLDNRHNQTPNVAD